MIIICSRTWHFCHVEDEISDLAKELILVDIPFGTGAPRDVNVGIKKCDALESLASLNGRRTQSVTNELCVVQLNDRKTYAIRARWKVYDCTLRESVSAILTATISRSYRCIDGLRRVAFPSGIGLEIVYDVPEELVSRAS